MKKITERLLGKKEEFEDLRKAKLALKNKGYCHQCCEPELRGRCKCGKRKNPERVKLQLDNRVLSNLLREFEDKEIKPLKELCIQCRRPWYDGMCECGGYKNEEVNAYSKIAGLHKLPIYFKKAEKPIKRPPPPTAKQLEGIFDGLHTKKTAVKGITIEIDVGE